MKYTANQSVRYLTTLNSNIATNKDLFWSCKGGAGCTGIITEMEFELSTSSYFTLIKLDIPWECIDRALKNYVNLMQTCTTKLDLKFKIRTTGNNRFYEKNSNGPNNGGVPLVHIDGLFLGSKLEARKLINQLIYGIHRQDLKHKMIKR